MNTERYNLKEIYKTLHFLKKQKNNIFLDPKDRIESPVSRTKATDYNWFIQQLKQLTKTEEKQYEVYYKDRLIYTTAHGGYARFKDVYPMSYLYAKQKNDIDLLRSKEYYYEFINPKTKERTYHRKEECFLFEGQPYSHKKYIVCNNKLYSREDLGRKTFLGLHNGEEVWVKKIGISHKGSETAERMAQVNILATEGLISDEDIFYNIVKAFNHLSKIKIIKDLLKIKETREVLKQIVPPKRFEFLILQDNLSKTKASLLKMFFYPEMNIGTPEHKAPNGRSCWKIDITSAYDLCQKILMLSESNTAKAANMCLDILNNAEKDEPEEKEEDLLKTDKERIEKYRQIIKESSIIDFGTIMMGSVIDTSRQPIATFNQFADAWVMDRGERNER